MNIKIFKCFTMLVLLLQMPIARAEVLPVKKEKKISKAYNVNADATAEITNKYGSIYVTTWEEDKIQIDVVITVEGKNEDVVNRRLNAIDVEFNPLKARIAAKTVFGSSTGNINMQVNYTVKIPRKGSIDLNNQYGNIVVDKILSNSAIECHYGNINVAELQGDSNTIKLKYCDKSAIGYAKNVVVDCQYSGLKLKKGVNLTYKGQYSNLDSEAFENVTYNADYGDLNLLSVTNLTLRGDYLQIKIGKLDGNLVVNSDYSTVIIGNVSARANNIALNLSYTTVDLKYDEDYSFDFDYSLKYTDLKSPGLTFQAKKESVSTALYKGFYKSSGKNKMSINADYGNIKLTKI